MSDPAKRARLIEILKQRSLKRGDFVLRSGQRSSYFLDGKQTTFSAEGAALVGELMYDLISDLDVVAVGGPTLGADPIATAISIESFRRGRPLDAFVVRKETKDHGMLDRIAGPLAPGSRVVIVEDTVTTGSAIQFALDAVREAGCEVARIVVIVDREAGARENLREQGYEFDALFSIRDLGIDPSPRLPPHPPPAQTRGRGDAETRRDAPEGEAMATELAELDRKNAEELRALRLPVEREPPFVFRAGPRRVEG